MNPTREKIENRAGRKPSSVSFGDHSPKDDDHSSRTPIAQGLKRPTRELGRAALNALLFGLAPGGVCRASDVTTGAGELLPHRFTLTVGNSQFPKAVCFLWHFPSRHRDWALPSTLPCGARTFLSPTCLIVGKNEAAII